MKVYLGLGSNLGDRGKNLRRACRMLGALKCSSVYETEPFGICDQPKFLNMVCAVESDLSPRELLEHCQKIERKIGRRKREKWGPREIDIDILFYGNRVIDEPDLKIPHPGVAERAFVLEPLKEIAPDFEHPVLHKTIAELF